MAAAKIAEASHLRNWIDGSGYDPFESAARLHFERIDHGMGRLAEGNHQHPVVGIEIVQVLANAKHTFVAIHVTLKGPVNAGLGQRVLKQVAGGYAHVE